MLRPVLVAVALATLLCSCGSKDPAAQATDPADVAASNGAQTYGGPGAGPSGGPQLPGAFGEIAAVQGKTLQVQNAQSGQVAVTWTAKTEITQQVAAARADVAVGSCVMAGSDTPATDASSDADPVNATTVRISQPVDGSCDGGFGSRADAPTGAPSGMPSGAPPSGAPSGAPSGGPGGGPRVFGGGAVGEVTAVSADGFTLESTLPGSTDARTVTVTVSADTTYSTDAKADGSALKVGRCVQASGDADSTGAITASRIGVSDPVDGQCGGGFGITGRPQ
jgi:hypothetical protein